MSEFNIYLAFVGEGQHFGCLVVQPIIIECIIEAQKKNESLQKWFYKMTTKDQEEWNAGSNRGLRCRNRLCTRCWESKTRHTRRRTQVKIYSTPWKNQNVQRPETELLVGRREKRSRRVRFQVPSLSTSKGRAPKAFRIAATSTNPQVEMRAYFHGFCGGITKVATKPGCNMSHSGQTCKISLLHCI